MSKQKIKSALDWSSLIWNADWTVSRLGPNASAWISSGGGMGASGKGSMTMGEAQLSELERVGPDPLGELGGWELGAGELGELLPATGSALGETDPSSVRPAHRVHSPELGKNAAQSGQVGWTVLRRAIGAQQAACSPARAPDNDASGVPKHSAGPLQGPDFHNLCNAPFVHW